MYDDVTFFFLQESKKLKRLKKARRDTDAGRSGLSDEDEFIGSGGGRTAEEQVEHTLFGDDGDFFCLLSISSWPLIS